MHKNLVLSGEVRSIKDKLKKTDKSLYARQYKVEIDRGDGDVDQVILVDRDLSREFKIGQMIENIQVRAEINDYQGLHVEFSALFNSNVKKQEAGEKKVSNMKV